MDEPTEILGYDVEVVGGVWHAKRRAPVNAEQADHGVQEVVTADSFQDLEAECIAQRIRASWYTH